MAKSRPSGASGRGLMLHDSGPTNQREFKTASELGFPPAKTWDVSIFPKYPKEIESDIARKKQERGIYVKDENNKPVRFDTLIIEHWYKKVKQKDDINGRLRHLPVALNAVQKPREIWDQGKQKAYIKAFKSKTGGKKGVVVFVEKNHVVHSYFPKDVNALEKARKGFQRIK